MEDNQVLEDSKAEQPKDSPANYSATTKKSKKSMVRSVSSNPRRRSRPAIRYSQRQGVWGISSKHVPKNIIHDKEHLYDDLIKLRKVMNTMKSENSKLKTKIIRSEKEVTKKNREVKEMLNQLNAPQRDLIPKKSTKTATDIVMSLKKKISRVQKENKTLKEGLDALRKSLRMTTTQELDAEINARSKECAKLRTILEELMQQNPYANSKEDKKLCKELKEQEKILKDIQSENKKTKEKVEKAKKELEEWKTKAKGSVSPDSSMQELMGDKMREIQKLKDQIEAMKKATKSKNQTDELQKEKTVLVKQSKENEQIIRDLEMELVELKRRKDSEIKAMRTVKGEEEVKIEKKRLDLVNKNLAHSIAIELKLNLMLSNIEYANITKALFKNYKDAEKISIHELAKTLRRTPGSLKSEAATKLSRYIIEPIKNKQIDYDEFMEETFSVVNKDLLYLVGEYTLDCINNPGSIQKSLLEKICEKYEGLSGSFQESADSNGHFSLQKLEKICKDLELGLSNYEMDYILLIMYKSSKDIGKLNGEKLLGHLEGLIKKLMPQEDLANFDHSKGKEGKLSEEYKERGLSSPKEHELSDDNLIEEQILGIMQKCLGNIAEAMANKGVTVKDLFKDKIYTKNIDGKKTELITHEDFMKGLKNIGINELSKDEEKYLKKMLSVNDDETEFRVNELIQIIEEYASARDMDEMKEATTADLDKMSTVLLLALYEYITNDNTSIYDIFGKAIHKQPVQIDEDELEIEIINSADFFEIINTIGIETEESQHDNLKEFLCIDPEYLDKFSIERLRMILDEFNKNESFREQAKKYYQELIEDDQLQEEGDVDNLRAEE